MTIRDLLVHIDQTQAAQIRLEAALTLVERFGAHVTALYLDRRTVHAQCGRLSPAGRRRCGSICATRKPRPSRYSPRRARRPSSAGCSWKRGLKPARSTACRRFSPATPATPTLIVVGEPNPEESGTDETAAGRSGVHGHRPSGAGGALCRRRTLPPETRHDRLGRLARGGAGGA